MRAFASVGVLLLSTFLAGSASAQPAMAEPWVDPDPDGPPKRYELGEDFGVAPMAEYRAQLTFVNPISLTTEDNRRYNVIEHRGRFGGEVDYRNIVKINLSMDLQDGTAWGDNGTFGELPSSDSGLNLTARDPNVTRACIGFIGDDPLDANSYGYTSCPGTYLKVRRLYGQVNTPIGAIRVGRQAVGVGMSVQNAAGDGRRNRFGVAYEGDQVDRVLFATKPLEAFKPEAERDTSENNGLIAAVMYDRLVSDSGAVFQDDVHQIATALRYLQPDFGIGENLEAQVFYAHRWNTLYQSTVNTVGGRLAARLGGFHIGTDMAANIGSTREVAASYSVITNDPIVDQKILQYGARAVARYDWRPDGRVPELPPMLTGYFEFDYASGDPDPQPRTPLTAFRWSEDTNVGLLLFDHVMRFQTDRAALAATEITRRLGATTFPSERVGTRGAFTNAMAIFPQVDFRPHDTVLFRTGVLVAWAPALVYDPVQSLQRRDGQSIEDDLVNFVGGKPGKFYGTELDARFQWRFVDHFALDLEGAVLFPGDALQDINGQAVNSFLMQGRTTFFF
ncbi:MAG: alginate export family protein [Myxococcales bacterium]|nr:alginate export family protein [Myxococcales bacterium]